jgi:hypothetical protein
MFQSLRNGIAITLPTKSRTLMGESAIDEQGRDAAVC